VIFMAQEPELKLEVRKDYLGRQVVLSVSRAGRPHDAPKPRVQKTTPESKCFFCPGNEHLTPPEIDRIEKDGKWEIRCFPNKFPAFNESSKKAYGRHEVVVETPEHQKTLSELSVENLQDYLTMVKRRMEAAMQDPRLKYSSVFKNEGQGAGASLEHSHTQLVAMDFVPKYVQKIAKKSAAFSKMEKKEKKGTWFSNEHFFAFCPKASRFPCETWIVPKKPANSLVGLSDAQLHSLAAALKSVLGALDSESGYEPYNIVYHSGPHDGSVFPFHLEILPRRSTWAGFEFATEVVMSSAVPADCAKTFRERLKPGT
jgi:UDPglucose--hexose-1-phosphate uridylyltransferase